MNQDNFERDANRAFDAAKKWLLEQGGAQGSESRLLPAELDAITALRYYAQRGDEVPESYPIAFGRVVLSGGETPRWWKDDVPEPLPFNPLAEKCARDEKGDRFTPIEEVQIRFTLGLSVLGIRDRLKRAG